MTDEPVRPCWEIRAKFCADLSNGRRRCAPGTCYVVEAARRREAET